MYDGSDGKGGPAWYEDFVYMEGAGNTDVVCFYKGRIHGSYLKELCSDRRKDKLKLANALDVMKP